MPSYYQRLLHIGKHSKNVIIGALLNSTFGFLITLFITNYLGAKLFGSYTYLLNYIVLIASMLQLGTHAGLAFTLPRAKEKKGSYITFSMSISFFVSLVISVLLLFYIDNIVVFLNDQQLSRNIILLAIPILLLHPLKSIIVASLRGYKKSKALVMVRDILSNLVFFMNIVIAVFLFMEKSIIILLLAQIGMLLICVIYGLFYLVKNQLISVPWILNKKEIIKFMRYAIIMLFSGFIAMLINRMDIAMIGYFLPSTDVGIYRAISRVATYIVFLNSNINVILGPEISRLASENKKEDISKIYQNITRWVTIFGALVFALIILDPAHIAGLFGKEFLAGQSVLVMISIGKFVGLIVGPVALLNTMMNHPKSNLISNVFVLFINFILNIWLIPLYGIMGAAIATAISIFLANTLRLSLLYYKERIHCFHWSILKPIISLIISLTLTFLFKEVLDISNQFLSHMSSYLFFVFLFISLLFVLQLTKEEKEIINRLIKK